MRVTLLREEKEGASLGGRVRSSVCSLDCFRRGATLPDLQEMCLGCEAGAASSACSAHPCGS